MSCLIPEGWFETSLGDVIRISSGKGLTKTKMVEGDIPVFGGNGITGWHNENNIDKETIVIGRVGFYCGSIHLTASKAWITDNAFITSSNSDLINQKFLYLLLTATDLRQNDSSTAQPVISGAKIYPIGIKLPPLAEQKVIADKLDELLAQVESTKARLDAIPAILKSFRQSVLAAAVSGKLTVEWREDDQLQENAVLKAQKYKKNWLENNKDHNEASRIKKRQKAFLSKSLSSENLPNNWFWGKLEDSVLMIVDCHNKTAPYVESGIPLIRTSNIRDGQFVWKNLKFVNQDTFAYWSKRCPPVSGDIIFTREAPMGEAAIIPNDLKVCLGQRTMLIRPIEQCISAKYLLIALMDPMFKKRSEEFAVGTGVKHYRVGDVSNLLIPVPSVDEQVEIVRRVEELFAFADKVEAQVNAAQERVNNLTQSILAKAFRGELTADWRAANPELISGDNSAEALLAKIKAEREKLKPVKKSRAKKAKV